MSESAIFLHRFDDAASSPKCSLPLFFKNERVLETIRSGAKLKKLSLVCNTLKNSGLCPRNRIIDSCWPAGRIGPLLWLIGPVNWLHIKQIPQVNPKPCARCKTRASRVKTRLRLWVPNSFVHCEKHALGAAS